MIKAKFNQFSRRIIFQVSIIYAVVSFYADFFGCETQQNNVQ